MTAGTDPAVEPDPQDMKNGTSETSAYLSEISHGGSEHRSALSRDSGKSSYGEEATFAYSANGHDENTSGNTEKVDPAASTAPSRGAKRVTFVDHHDDEEDDEEMSKERKQYKKETIYGGNSCKTTNGSTDGLQDQILASYFPETDTNTQTVIQENHHSVYDTGVSSDSDLNTSKNYTATADTPSKTVKQNGNHIDNGENRQKEERELKSSAAREEAKEKRRRCHWSCCCGLGWFMVGAVALISGVLMVVLLKQYWTATENSFERRVFYFGATMCALGSLSLLVSFSFLTCACLRWNPKMIRNKILTSSRFDQEASKQKYTINTEPKEVITTVTHSHVTSERDHARGISYVACVEYEEAKRLQSGAILEYNIAV